MIADGVIASLNDGFFYHSAGPPATVIVADRLGARGIVVGGARTTSGVEFVK